MMLMSVMMMPATASPRTNFEAPSMAPKNPLSSSSVRRRACASLSSMRPAPRSASIAICLPGIASSEKRAETSAIRVEPLVMTMKLITTRIAKITMPMTKLPATMKREKPSITPPAAPDPVWPCERISRVEATFSDSRRSVTTSSSVGKALNSSGVRIQSATISTRTETDSESARPRSSSTGGSGTKSTARISVTPIAKPMSRLAMLRPNMAPEIAEIGEVGGVAMNEP